MVGALIEKVARTEPRIAACGEMSPQLLAAGMIVQAIRLEQLWDLMVYRFSLDTLCAYSSAHLEKDSDAFRSICAEHSAIYSG